MSSPAPAPPIRPVVAVVADSVEHFHHRAHLVLDGYVRALRDAAQVLPLLLPVADRPSSDTQVLLDTIDGIVLTGSPSNVAGECYGADALPDHVAQDPWRDATVLPLIPALLAARMPMLAVCRGLQEINVALGGSLEPQVHRQPGRMDHREGDHDRPLADWYADRHEVCLVPGGLLARLAGGERAIVNSLHHQGIERLAQGLRIEATAPDGLVEAVTVADAPQFTLGVQWHPEMRVHDDVLSQRIFAAFGDACRAHRAARQGAVHGPALAEQAAGARASKPV